MDDSQKRIERVKITVRAFIELLLAFAITRPESTTYFLFYSVCIFSLAAIRSIFHDFLDLFITLFVGCYTMLNLSVNVFDFLVYRKAMGFYDDVDFHHVFSYKYFQIIQCLIIAFVFSQSIQPTFQTIKEYPPILNTVFNLTIPTNILMLATFLFELTFYD